MSEVLRIIDQDFKSKLDQTTFEGNVYFKADENLEIDRNVHNRLVDKYNAAFEAKNQDYRISLSSDLYIVFINEIFEDNSASWTRMDRNYYLSAIIHENALWTLWSEETKGSDKKPDSIGNIGWEFVDHIELLEDKSDNTYFFRFHLLDDTDYLDLFSNRFGTYDLDTCWILLELLNKIVETKKETILNSTNEHDEFKSGIKELLYEENYDRALDELERFGETYEVDDVSYDDTPFYYLNKTSVLISLEQYEKALTTIDSFIKKYDDTEVPPYAHELKGLILLNTNNYLRAINYLAISEDDYEVVEHKEDAIALKEESYSRLKEVFLEVPYNERKLIFIGDSIHATHFSEMVVLKKNDLPVNIHFPVGHPHINEVYTCHPHKQDFYLPLKSYSEELFLDRIHEFSWLLQCLGAVQLEITSSKSELSDQSKKSKTEVDVQADYKVSGGKVNYQGENTGSALVDGNLNIAKKQVFKPFRAPFVPDDLVWYHSNSSWQRLATQRLSGGIMMHSELISSSQSETISTHELTKVEAELKLLLPKLGVKYNKEEQVNTTSTKKHEWMVNVEFADISDLLPSEQPARIEPTENSNSDTEFYKSNREKYKEDVLLMIEDDGIIDESERNILNRKIKRYGLTEEDARAIENEMLTSGYSENELNYIQELKELLDDGEITEIERKILDRYASRYGVPTEVQKKIDAVFIQ